MVYMTNTDMIDKIVQKSGITREQAEDALNKNNWDLLDAMIYVERNYQTTDQSATSSSQYSTYTKKEQNFQPTNDPYAQNEGKDKITELLEKLCNCLVNDRLVISRNGKDILPLPIIIFVLLLISSFSAILVIMIISMFFDVKYYCRGQLLGNDDVNGVFDQLFNFVQKLKREIKNLIK